MPPNSFLTESNIAFLTFFFKFSLNVNPLFNGTIAPTVANPLVIAVLPASANEGERFNLSITFLVCGVSTGVISIGSASGCAISTFSVTSSVNLTPNIFDANPSILLSSKLFT